MISTIQSSDVIIRATEPYQTELVGFHPVEWLRTPGNIALTNDDEDVALFERQYRQPRVVCGHYFFKTRGKKARDNAREFLKEIFNGPYEVESIVGVTPLNKRGALWMNRQLGFIEHGDIDTPVGPCRFVMLTKQEWEKNQ